MQITGKDGRMDFKNLSRTLKGAVIVSVLAAFCLAAMASPLLYLATTKPLRMVLTSVPVTDAALVASVAVSAVGFIALVAAGALTWRLFTRIGAGRIFEPASTALLLKASIVYIVSAVAWTLDCVVWFPCFEVAPYAVLAAASLAAIGASLSAIALALSRLNREACALDDELKMVV